MAVYKATHCYPMLNNIDTRIVATAERTKPAEYLKCKIDTSNKPITGYSIRILDSLNNQLFPYGDSYARISPVSELSGLIENEDYINTGLNGSFLHIPFFQNRDYVLYDGSVDGERLLLSYNAIYFQAKFTAHYILEASELSADKWHYDSASECLVNDGWDGMINGENALVDEVVLVLSTSNQDGGLWKFQPDGSLTRYIINRGLVSKSITFEEVNDNGVLITRGTYHNTVYTYSSSNWVTNLNNGWEDAYGHQLTWHNMGDSYKWEITLYQGEGTVNTSLPQSITYSDMDYTWYDMVMQSGTILGTTNKRLQLGNTDDSGLTAKIPYGTETDPLVVQGRYAQLIDTNGKDYGSRGYIQAYDASFGFAYPHADAFTINDINTCNRVAFYKYSNDPNAIAANDIVKYATTATTGNIPGLYGDTVHITETFTYYLKRSSAPSSLTLKIDNMVPNIGDTVFYQNSTTLSTRKKYKVTGITRNDSGTQITAITYEEQTFTYSSTAYYSIVKGAQYGGSFYHNDTITKQDATGLIVVDGNRVEEGDLVLVKDQTDPWENGVYVVHDKGSTNTRWSRSGSYNSWGSFIGKILYVQRGSENGGKNFESLANAGGTLYTGGANGSGQSPLYFTPEKPIVLFAQDLYRTDIDLATVSAIDTSLLTIDGVTLTEGMLVYSSQVANSSGKIIRITSVGALTYTYGDVETFSLSDHKYLYIKNGKRFGHAVVSTNYTSDPDELCVSTLYNAYLLKNTTTHTYISPYINVKKNMALKLLDYHTVTYNDTTVSAWIKINNINTNTWCISHNALASNSILQSMDELNPEAPYKYEIRSFYRTSDENLFYCYETPYLKLNYNGEGYSDLVTWQPYDVVGTNTWDEYDVLKQAGGSVYLDFMVHGASLTAITDRYVTLQGFYRQFQNLSWVSYRWILTDSLGNILQDTGKKFDKNMEVSFYGLANDVDNNVYYAILYVEDELKQTLTFTVKLIVDPNGAMSLNLPFHATYECQTHSVVLEYDDNGQILPSINTESNIALGYINENSMYITGWDNSVVYQDEKVYITEPNRLYETPIINRYENQDELIANTSLTVKKGLGYSHFFPSDDTKVPVDSHKISFADEVLSLQTELQLDDNYCGDFLTLDLVESDNDTNYVRLVLSLDPGMDASTPSTPSLNTDRYYVRARLEAVTGGSVQKSVSGYLGNSEDYFNWRTIFNNKPVADYAYQTLQPKRKIEDIKAAAIEHPADFQYTKIGKTYYPWYIKNAKNDKFNTYGCTALGNLCLISNYELDVSGLDVSGNTGLTNLYAQNTSPYCNGSLPYWVEKRPTLVLVETLSPLRETDFITMTPLATSLEDPETRSWPSDFESNYFWLEQDDGNDPGKESFYESLKEYSTWNKLMNATNTSNDLIFGNHGIVQIVAMPRYYGILSKQKWIINVNCHDLTTLYNAMTDGSPGDSPISCAYDSNSFSANFIYNTVTYCSVTLRAEEVE